MSNYRDDMNDTLVLADAIVSKQHSRAEDALRLSDAMQHGVRQSLDGGAVALADELQDRALSAQTEGAGFGDEVRQRVKRRQQVVETLKLFDRVRQCMQTVGLPLAEDTSRDFDHGVFIPGLLMYPQAQIPTLQISLRRGLDPQEHLALGHALGGHGQG